MRLEIQKHLGATLVLETLTVHTKRTHVLSLDDRSMLWTVSMCVSVCLCCSCHGRCHQVYKQPTASTTTVAFRTTLLPDRPTLSRPDRLDWPNCPGRIEWTPVDLWLSRVQPVRWVVGPLSCVCLQDNEKQTGPGVWPRGLVPVQPSLPPSLASQTFGDNCVPG
jgi:hypothetical protein